ncbi:MAG: insulinase family protein [Bacteroidia bacterium]|nr:insulinase family protein [Bacteroidia bacterium]
MKKQEFIFLLCLSLLVACTGNKYQLTENKDKNGYSYQSVTNDPSGMRLYTLKNGLKVYLGINKDEPRIMTMIAVHAGSNNEPEATTGLAHYFEHLMFKGTSLYGTRDWEKEKPLLDSISGLFELYRAQKDSVQRLNIYKRIDKFSIEAAQYALPSEYAKMLSEIGASGTNAFTSNEMTVYINDIPANEIKPWLNLEKNRFGDIALRLFHTELETVYEEFNMYQDRDQSRASTVFGKALFPKNPLGRDVIGYPEHLKNPSQVNIINFKNTWYVPNNMAICLSGDLDMEKTIQLIDETFGQIPSKPVPEVPIVKEDPITSPVEKEIYGPDAEFLLMGYRTDGENSPDKKYIYLLGNILANGQAGLFDIDLVQDQKVLYAYAYPIFNTQYGNIVIYVTPKEKQTLAEVKDLVLAEIEKLKKGEFPDWIIEAIANDYRLSNLRQFRSRNETYAFMDAFIYNKNWIDVLSFGDKLEKVTKQELIDYANQLFKDNYVALYKKTGVAKDLIKVQKPPLTAVTINRNEESKFFTEWKKIPSDSIAPVFVDFNTAINRKQIREDIELNTIQTTNSELFSAYYVINAGKDNIKKVPLAINFLPYVGTSKHTATELKQELYRYGLSTSVYSSNTRSYVYVSGLNRNLEKGIQLLEEIINSSLPDTAAYTKYAERIIKERDDVKLNQDNILFSGLWNYAMHGNKSSQTDVFSNEEIRKQNPDELIGLVKTMVKYPHKIFYCGPMSLGEVETVIRKNHSIPEKIETIPAKTVYPELDIEKNQVLVTNYDMSQVNLLMVAKGAGFSPELLVHSSLFNQYFGGSLASIVFQEVREAQGMAYSASAWYESPSFPDESFFIVGYVATQADKMNQALTTMNRILNNFTESDHFLMTSKRAILNRISTQRLYRENLFFRYLNNLDLGINHDQRKDVYDYITGASMKDLQDFFSTYIKDKKYTYCVIGNLKNLDMKALKEQGEVKEIPLKDLFGY